MERLSMISDADEVDLAGAKPIPDDLPLESVRWFHGSLLRHYAEAMLRHNGQVGTYMLRKAPEQPTVLVLSVRLIDTVGHFRIIYTGSEFQFSSASFPAFDLLIKFLDSQPTFVLDNGISVTLAHPYPRCVEELSLYENVRIHRASLRRKKDPVRHSQSLAMSGKEGYLTKQGQIHKNWKVRWFVLDRHFLKYYKNQGDAKPISALNLAKCEMIGRIDIPSKQYGFCLTMPNRTLLVYSSSQRETDEWISILVWRMDQIKADHPESADDESISVADDDEN